MIKQFGDNVKIVKEVDLTNSLEESLDKVKKSVGKYIDTIASDLNKPINVDIFNFVEFNNELIIPEFGEYYFQVEQKFLKEATKIIGLSSNSVGGLIEITLFKDKMKLAYYNQKVFSEIFIPLAENFNADGIDKNSNSGISFSFNQEMLNKVASRFVDSVITFTLNVDKNTLAVHSGNTKLELEAPYHYPPIDYHLKLADPKYFCKLDVDILRDAIKYVSYFVQKNEVKKNISQVDCDNRMLYGGSYSSVGIYQSTSLNYMSFNIRFECLSHLYKILPYFNKANTHIFETKNYFLIRDENLYFGFEKSNYTFPPIDKFLKADLSKDKIIVSRRDLLRSLDKLSIVVSGGKPLIKLKVCEGEELKLFVKDLSGKISKDIINITSTEKLPDFNFIIEFETFMKVISHFSSETVCLNYVLNKALVIEDEGENFIVKSNFSLFMEEHLKNL